MKSLFLIDENLSPLLVDKLEQLGYFAKSIKEIGLRGVDDITIIKWAIKNNAIIITGDLDFGKLWHLFFQGKVGIIVLRIKTYKFEDQYKMIKFLHDNNIFKKEGIKNSLVVSTLGKFRIRK